MMSATDLSRYFRTIQVEGVGWDIRILHEDVRVPLTWSTQEDRHRVLLHLSGRMHHLETELEGTGGSSGEALSGECWTIPAGRKYSSSIRGPEIIRYLLVSFDPALLRPGGSGASGGELKALSGRRDMELMGGAQCLERVAVVPEENGSLRQREVGEHLMRHVLGHYRGDQTVGSPSAMGHGALRTSQIRRIRAYIMDQLGDELNLDDMAHVVGMTPHRFLIAFRKTFDMTPWQYVISQRLRCAQRLLQRSSIDISEVALESGFSSHSHLCSVFRRCLKMSPTEYRGRL